MKKIFFVVVVLFYSVSFGNAASLGIPATVVQALDDKSECARITETDQEIDFVVSGGFVVGRDKSGNLIRFITFKRSLPLRGNAVTVKSRSVVNVVSCGTDKQEKITSVKTDSNKKTAVATNYRVNSVDDNIKPQKEYYQPKVTPKARKVATSNATSGAEVKNLWDAIDTFNVSYATYSPFNDEKERYGEGWNVKARVRPFKVGKATVGGYATWSDGEGRSHRANDGDRWSHFNYKNFGGGFSGLYDHGDDMTSELDLGLLWQDSEGWKSYNDFHSWQSENQLDFRYKLESEHRRKSGEIWFPAWETGFHYTQPFNVSYHDTKGRGNDYAYDNQRIRLWGMGDIYDWYLDDAGKWCLTPTFNAELGYLWGKDSGYIQGGPGAKLGWRGQEIFEFKFLNPRLVFEENGSRIYDFIGTVKVDNLVRAVLADGTKNYKPETSSVDEEGGEVVILR
jgi:hypothetical protein